MKTIRIFIWKLSVFGSEIFNIFEQVCFRNEISLYIRAVWSYVVRMKRFCILGLPNCAQRKFFSDCGNLKADLKFRWAHMPEGTFSDVARLLSWYSSVFHYSFISSISSRSTIFNHNQLFVLKFKPVYFTSSLCRFMNGKPLYENRFMNGKQCRHWSDAATCISIYPVCSNLS